MSWNGQTVIDLDSHIVERADRFYQDYIDPAYRDAYRQLCDGVAQQAKAGQRHSLFGSRNSVIEPIETGRPLGVRDTFGLTRRSDMEGGRKAFPPGRADALPPIRISSASTSRRRRRTESSSTIRTCTRSTTWRRTWTCRCSRMAARRDRRTDRGRSILTGRGSCCTASPTRGPAWPRSAR